MKKLLLLLLIPFSVFGQDSLITNKGIIKTTVDTTAIPNFYSKVRSLFSVTAPITYNTATGGLAITQSTTSTNGYLSSTDWNTFNGKGSGTVTNIATGLGLSGGPITTTGTLLVDTANASILSRQRAVNTYGIAFPSTTNKYQNGYGNYPTLNMDSITNGTSNMYEVSQSSAPTATGGRLWNNTSFPSPPSSNSAFTWNPGLFYTTGTTFIPLTIEGAGPYGSTWAGDSWTANFGLSGAANGFVNKTAFYKGWSLINSGVSGSTMLDVSSFLAATNDITFLEVGINDMRTLGTAALSNYSAMLRNWGVFKAAGSKTNGTSGTKTTPADWIADSVLFNFTTSTRTTVSNSPITFSLAGSSVYVSIAYMTSSDVVYNVTIDNVSKGNFSAACTGYAPAGVNPNQNAVFYCQRFSGIGDTLHSIVLKKISGTGQFRVIYVASNGKPKQSFGNGGARVFVSTVGRMATGVAGVSGYGLYGGNDARVDSFNRSINNIVYQLASDGLNVQVIDINNYYSPRISGYVQSDSMHPADPGATAYASALIERSSTMILPKEREEIQYLSSLVTTDSTGNININSPTGNLGILTSSPSSALSVGSNSFQVNSTGNIVAATGLTLTTAGNKINIATGTNASVGSATLVGGTVTVSTTAVTTSSKIFLTDATTGVLTNIGTPTVGTIVAGTSFVINSSNVLDTSSVNWIIIN